jgi:histidinol-phosphate phosphatase family protein
MTDYSIVIPTMGRPNLWALLDRLDRATGPAPREVIVVDDRVNGTSLALPAKNLRIRVVQSWGRGPAAARNTGWHNASDVEWIAFLDDDVLVPYDWPERLAEDLDAGIDASQARISAPLPENRRPTDWERGTAGLENARWITADMAYRRDALEAVGGFDERFPRAFREDADLAMRVILAGFTVAQGNRVTEHPVRAASPMASLKAQRGNADNALMRRKYGRHWRQRIGEGPGLLAQHAATAVAGLAAFGLSLAGQRKSALAAGGVWAALTGRFAAKRIAPGPRTKDEIGRMLLTSALIPPAACLHRLAGEWRHRRVTGPPLALLFDRDDTLIEDVPYLNDPGKVRPMPGAAELLRRLRGAGMRLGVVSNQSGVAKGLVTPEQLAAVNARVDELLGPFGTWQVCPHDDADGCACRKPLPGLVKAAVAELGIPASRCVVIGDIAADVRAAQAAGARAILVPTVKTRPIEVWQARRTARVAGDLTRAVRMATGVTR